MPTIAAIVLTFAIGELWPGVLAYFSWRLASLPDASPLIKAVAAGLAAAARVFLVLELLRAICRPRGLGEAHLGWPSENVLLLRRHIKWLGAAVVPLVFLVATLHWRENEHWSDSLGRMAFVAAMACFAVFVERMLRPRAACSTAFLPPAAAAGWTAPATSGIPPRYSCR